ncbi:MAG: 4Fe-4S binding protein [Bryobacteraceae bacterium]
MAAVSERQPEPVTAGKQRGRSRIRRHDERSQWLRRTFQWTFLLLNLWIGAEFYLFVRYWETGGATPFVPRPAGVEGWLPIAGLMNLKAWIVTGRVPAVHPAAAVLLAAFLIVSWLFRKSFCSWLCPIGTLSEHLWRLGRRLFGRNFALPRALDIPLRSLKYLLLGFFLWAIAGMSAAAIEAFMRSPYGLIADVKMLNFFRHLSATAAIVLTVLLALSLLVQNFWCRYLCPYGALVGLAALLSPLRIRRDPAACIDCAKCARVCPACLPVDRLVEIRSAECTGCLECVAVCPVAGALELSAPRRVRVPAWVMAAGIALVFVGLTAWAQFSGHWRTDLPPQIYRDLIPRAHEFTHP